MINESKQSKKGPIHKMSYRLDKRVYNFCIESIGEVVKDSNMTSFALGRVCSGYGQKVWIGLVIGWS